MTTILTSKQVTAIQRVFPGANVSVSLESTTGPTQVVLRIDTTVNGRVYDINHAMDSVVLASSNVAQKYVDNVVGRMVENLARFIYEGG